MKSYTVLQTLCIIGIILAVCILVAGCSGSREAKEKQIKKELAQMAQNYVMEKYGMDDAKVVEVKLSYAGLNGPIPVFKREVPKSGTVTLEFNGASFRVLAGPTWNRYSDELKNVLSDNYQTERIKADIQEQLIDKFKVTDEYYVQKYSISSELDHGGIDYFTLKQKYDGDLETFLQNSHFGLELEIFFKGGKANQNQYFDQTKELFHQLASRFSNGESEISLYVNKEDKYMDARMKEILDIRNPQAIDPIIYGPAYNYCRLTGEIHNTQYIERIKKEFPETDMKPLEMKENRFEYVDVGEGISLASMLENVEFRTPEDVVFSARPLTEDDSFTKADYSVLDPDKEDQFDYKLLSDNVYRVSYPKQEYNGNEVDWDDPIAVKINRSQVPQTADRLFLVHGGVSDENSGNLIIDLDDPNFLTSADSWIAPARTDSDFVIVYRSKK